MMRGMDELRAEIDRADEQIVKALLARLSICDEIALLKSTLGMPAFDASREAEVIKSREAMARDERDREAIGKAMREIIRLCRDRQERILKGVKQ